MARLTRLLRIFAVGLRFGLHEFIPRFARNPFVRLAARRTGEPRAQRLREALETLGPIYVKFGQVLSTRRDLVPLDIADELAKLQDRVPPFPSDLAIAEIEKGLGRGIEAVFATFEREPVASASIAQVHLARLHDGREVAVKVLRPRVEEEIAKDVALLATAADFVERLWPDGRRLKPREVVAEFARHLEDELNLMHEAANASQLRRNFERSALLLVPEVHWDLCSERVMVMQRMHGTPVSQVETLRAKGVDIPALARAGVEIFFTQVFRDGFFHADMHPGNILVTTEGEASGRYVALDFGIMGTLTEVDKNYLAQNFLAFFNRDYRRVAQAHLDAGWVPADTRIDEFETAIRAVWARTPARPRSRPVAQRQALPRALDERAGGLARHAARAAAGSALLGLHPAATAAPRAPRPLPGPARRARRRARAPHAGERAPQRPSVGAPRGIHRGADSSRHQPALMLLRTLAAAAAAAMMARAC